MKYTCTECCLMFLKNTRTEAETIKYLKDNDYSESEIDEAIKYAKEVGYINDIDYINAYVSDHLLINKWGPQKIIFKLKEKGISGEAVNFALMDNEEIIKRNLYAQVEKKAQGLNLEDFKTKQKVINHLVSRGYDYSSAKNALEDYIDDNR
ncbi:regulatory protein RecX [Ezakiella coagulans]|uniref:regulatory protein RecX n=1 Tax=Ezakiella coagulans TaxID=46507 RepID=UPI002014A15E|nr:RecX family transcriptional regulator [Ezakiella coagulans]UQK60776.1 RecX family transcriptional regulator [Ezakiella coagulans]